MREFKPSVTVAAVVFDAGRFLFVEEETVAGVRLNQPAGHLDPGESLVHAVVREAIEETAHHVVPEALIGVYLSRFEHLPSATEVTYLRFAFACRLADRPGGAYEPERPLDHGILRTHWLNVDEIRAQRARHRSELVMQVVEDHLAGRRHPLDVLWSGAGLNGLPGMGRECA
jgi:8-oxo-dGTP pyrophosphatase MutT (NUDIX family)